MWWEEEEEEEEESREVENTMRIQGERRRGRVERRLN